MVQAIPVPCDRPGPAVAAALQRLQAPQAARDFPGELMINRVQLRCGGSGCASVDTMLAKKSVICMKSDKGSPPG